MCRSPSPRGRYGGTQGRPAAEQDEPRATERRGVSAAPQSAASKAAAAGSEAAGTPSGNGDHSEPVGAPSDLVGGLHRSPKYLPCRFLYDERGSQLYEQITALQEYYPYETEKLLLAQHAAAIASQFPAGSVVVELGCGDCTKTALLLQALVDRHGPTGIRFCAMDCSAEALRQTERSLGRLVPDLPRGQVDLVEAEYLAGVEEARRRYPDAMLSILWLGSSVGNFSGSEAVQLLGALRRAAGERCQLLLGTDMWKDVGVLLRAYHDGQGVSSAFILNGMRHALGTLGHPAAADAAAGLFDYELGVNAERQQVEMWVRAQRRVPHVLPGLHIEQGEQVLVEISRKFTPAGIAAMAGAAGLLPCGGTWGSAGIYSLTLLLTPEVALQRCWADSDSLFAHIGSWEAQPIELRHPFGFYFGHVAAFAKLKLLPQEPATALDVMLSRGIDPLVDDPSQCHSHPAVPDRWPDQAQLTVYAAGVRAQLLAAVQQGVSGSTALPEYVVSTSGGSSSGAARVSMHALCMAVDHERQHQETLCYMLAQQRKADAAAAAAGRPAVLASQGSRAVVTSGNEVQPLPLESSAGTVLPFYLQQCSCMHALTSPTTSPAAAAPACAVAPVAPATPAKTERLPGRLGVLSLQDGATVEPAKSQQLGSSGCEEAGAGFVHIPGGEVCLGIDPAAERGFNWCCELGRAGPLAVPGLLVACQPVTVAQFKRFVFEEQGYQRPELWDGRAYRHLSASGHSMPATWSLLPADVCPPGSSNSAATNALAVATNGQAGARGSAGHSPQQQSQEDQQQLWVHMPEGSYRWEEVADCPAYVSLAEAQAYARWAGGRLLTEAEYELTLSRADQSSLAMSSPAATAGSSPYTSAAAGEAASAAASRAGTTGSGQSAVCQLESGGWEWTATPLHPLPGWRPDPLYPQYSADFFDGHHFVLRGSSPYTHPGAARRSFRNWYQQLYPFVFAKFRVAKDA